MPDYKLFYFDLRCRAEPIRLILEYAKQKYENVVIPGDQWPSIKNKMPMGQVPVLQVDGTMLCQSTAIARYLADEFGLTGSNKLEAARCDMLVDCVFDMWGHIRPVYMAIFAKDETKKKENWGKFKKEHFDEFLKRFDTFLDENGGKYLVGDKLTWTDLATAEFLSCIVDCFDAQALDKYDKLKEYSDNILQHDNIKDYVHSRGNTIF